MAMIERISRTVAAPGGDSTGAPAPETALARTSSSVWCRNNCARAVISVIERRSGTSFVRYVQWCSLLGIEVECDEHCLACLDGRPADESHAVAPPSEDAHQTANAPPRAQASDARRRTP